MTIKIPTYEELKNKYLEEEVLVIEKIKYPFVKNGITFFSKNEFKKIIKEFEKDSYFVKRYNAEYNPKYFQLIPYVVIKYKNKFLGAKRIGGDERLVGKFFMGMGGHINPCDFDKNNFGNTFLKNIKRELSKEELYIDLNKTIDLKFKGIIFYSNKNDLVSQDHIGLLYILETNDDKVSIKETDKIKDSKLYTVKEILENSQIQNNAESWTKLVIEALKNNKI